ncbi:hypothetical protein L0664_08080 [Octadecabacter sp. G9-8]|uniref:Uncharacterized protein n=1 Tax=Octadecabacter dasysiphoniae TaxID=2909341 RepID=A0ABS9CXW9_9RHOB|nr:hypothetical protein [Octadecabacter dasysiphoniae]MCF2871021.1 hypothetical protein [Octadecabacter dasysiphoniae]
MSGVSVAFVLIPCIAAVITAAVISDWRLAAAAFFGAVGMLFLAPTLPDGVRVFGSPVFSGVAIGAATLVAQLLWRPTVSTWSRMTAAMMVTFAVTFGHLISLGVF